MSAGRNIITEKLDNNNNHVAAGLQTELLGRDLNLGVDGKFLFI